MESKGIAIPYIIALVIGIIVLVFVVYWVYRLFSAPQISIEECKARMLQWCNTCSALGWTGGPNSNNTIGTNCATLLKSKLGVNSYSSCDTSAKTDCNKVGWSG